ncbi:NmrA-like family protein [Aspergillus homomorphus CBS 101889]|uniref:NmrA-like family protein n=1 Tax=Aspergillus homomorphus (strain CBS 101889) TaxID=1450537 RepID=A0A395I4R8_ASPHC|nr:NmrA-like family protein [Aspergillus homomorphus CBS 101889]RAL14765.1 NmrA-like family protein [Aspergillus homomorphus CBS 101889]
MAFTVGVAGITDKFAGRVVSHLLQQSDLTNRGYCRDPSKVPESIASAGNVTLFKGQAFDKAAVRSFAEGCDVIVCCYLGDDKLMVEGQKVLIDACEELGVPRYVASDWALDYTLTKVQGVHILIGGFMKPVLSPFFNVLDTQNHIFRYWGEGDEYMEGTTYDNAAELTAAVIRDPQATGILPFLGGWATIRGIAQSYEKTSGFKANLKRLGSLVELYQAMDQKRDENPGAIYSYMSLFFYYYWVNGRAIIGPETDNAKYPDVKPVDWEGFMGQWSLQQLPTAYFALNA